MIEVPRGSVERQRWDSFVDSSADAWLFHRSEWLDYSMVYASGAVDRSVAMLDGNGEVVGVSPAIDDGGVVRMGGDPCVGPVGISEITPERFLWRWTQPGTDTRETIKRLQGMPRVARTEWQTVVQALRGRSLEDRWSDIRKSYRAVIRRVPADYNVIVGGLELWPQFAECHRAAAKRPRSIGSYEHQRAMIQGGYGRVAIAVDGEGLCVASVVAFVYRRRAYYASGPSIRRGVQHAVLWAMSKHLADEGVEAFEIGWTGQPGGSENIEFFKRGFGSSRESVVVLSRN